ncbi:MAG: polysaccharide deacetylase family protein [Gammaproteobacteria bacterium]|nr:MAG: polysaccharide deacetylase family protein [Gammaproteobacteria bacterium]
MIKTLLGLSLKGGDKCRLSIIDYHRITPEKDQYVDSVTQAELDWQCSILKEFFNVLPLEQAVDLLQKGQLPTRSAVITFDDGYANNCALALPVLEKWDLPATFFIASGFLDGGIMWNDAIIEAFRRTDYESLEISAPDSFPEDLIGFYDLSTQKKRVETANKFRLAVKYLDLSRREDVVAALVEIAGVKLPKDIMLTSEQVKEIYVSGMAIGGHTQSHPILTTISVEKAKQQIMDDKEKLQQIIGADINHFAYPNGIPRKDFLPVHTDILQELGYKAAVTTKSGVSSPQTDLYQLPRFSPWDKTTFRYLYRMFMNGLGVYG